MSAHPGEDFEASKSGEPPESWWKTDGWKWAWAACSAFLLMRAGPEARESSMGPWFMAIVGPPIMALTVACAVGAFAATVEAAHDIHPGCGWLAGAGMLLLVIGNCAGSKGRGNDYDDDYRDYRYHEAPGRYARRAR